MISLTTDFGYKDPFAGIMKGVILSINPEALIIDLTHGISPQNVMEAALVIGEAFKYFPEGSTHLAVVDPGVGSERKPIAVSAGGRFFVGPDNGIFTDVFYAHEGQFDAFEISNEKFMLPRRGSTFHGRDIFAPAAACLSMGVNPSEFGQRIDNPVTIDIPRAESGDTEIKGEVIMVDTFGNLITNISADHIETLLSANPEGSLQFKIRDVSAELVQCYSQASKGAPYALVNSSGLLEIFIYKGNAASGLSAGVGEAVSLVLTKSK